MYFENIFHKSYARYATFVIFFSIRTAEKNEIYVGSVDLTKGGVYHNVSKVVHHPKYSTHSLAYRVVLLRLTEKLQYNENVQPIELSSNMDEDGSKGFICMLNKKLFHIQEYVTSFQWSLFHFFLF